MFDLIARVISSIFHFGKRVSDTAATGRSGARLSGVRLQPFGIITNPPKGSPVFAFCEHGNLAEARFVITGDANPPQPVQEGETLIYGGGSTILLKTNGDIEIRPAGDVKVIGGDVIADGVSLKSHTHPQNSGNHFGGGVNTSRPNTL